MKRNISCNSGVIVCAFYHCRVGADRTGTVAYLLEGLLGVPDEDRYEEYSLTRLSGLYDRTRYYKLKAENNAYKFVFMMDYVKTTQDIYDWYMQNPNADAGLIQAFRSAMVSGTSSSSTSGSTNNTQNQSSSNRMLASINRATSAFGISSTDANNASTDNSDTEYDGDANEGYSPPLGVSTTTTETYSSNDNNPGIESSSSIGLAVAATFATIGAVTAVAAIKNQNSNDEQ